MGKALIKFEKGNIVTGRRRDQSISVTQLLCGGPSLQ